MPGNHYCNPFARLKRRFTNPFKRPRTPPPQNCAVHDHLTIIHPHPCALTLPSSSPPAPPPNSPHQKTHTANNPAKQTGTKPPPNSPCQNPPTANASATLRRICTTCGANKFGLYEFPTHLPTAKCRHANCSCAYCLHDSVYAQFQRLRGWKGIKCPVCKEEMSEEEGRRCVVGWMEEG